LNVVYKSYDQQDITKNRIFNRTMKITRYSIELQKKKHKFYFQAMVIVSTFLIIFSLQRLFISIMNPNKNQQEKNIKNSIYTSNSEKKIMKLLWCAWALLKVYCLHRWKRFVHFCKVDCIYQELLFIYIYL